MALPSGGPCGEFDETGAHVDDGHVAGGLHLRPLVEDEPASVHMGRIGQVDHDDRVQVAVAGVPDDPTSTSHRAEIWPTVAFPASTPHSQGCPVRTPM